MAEEVPNLLRPRPIRPYGSDYKTSDSSTTSTPGTPFGNEMKWNEKDEKGNILSGTRSVLNLTSSTLYGIYDSFTPSSNGAQTPLPRTSVDENQPPVIGAFATSSKTPYNPPPPRRLLIPLVIRTILLFLAGVVYGIVISQLHDTQRIAPVQIVNIERWSWGYLLGWGGVGVVLGVLLPWADVFWEDVLGVDKEVFPSHQHTNSKDSASGSDDGKPIPKPKPGAKTFETSWYPMVRSITAFIGVAFAIRRLPWASTLQVSITLALVNPVLWYLFDRSKPGFVLSTIVGVAGTFIALGVNPDIVPSPATSSHEVITQHLSHDNVNPLDGVVSVERVGVGTWIASVLFCSSLCFGNIGRRLELASPSKIPSL